VKEDTSTAVGGRSPGALLRETREARGISLDEASRVTRIGKNYLAALESDRPDRLPSPAYVRGFLRNYASFLGITVDSLTSEYQDSGAVQAVPDAARSPEKEDKPPQRTDSRRGRPVTLPLLFISAFLVVTAGYFFVQRISISTPAPPRAASPPVVKPAVQIPESPPVPSAAPPTALPDQAAGTPDRILRMKVNEETRLVMTIDDTVVQEYQLRPGDVIEWKGDRSFAVELTNAGGVEAELAGKPLRPFGPRGAPARVVVRTDGKIE